MKLLKKRTHGAALVEYVVLLALIAGLSIVAVTTIGEEIREDYEMISTVLSSEIPDYPAAIGDPTAPEGGGPGGPTTGGFGPPTSITVTDGPSGPGGPGGSGSTSAPNIQTTTNGFIIDLTNNREYIRSGVRINADIFQDGTFFKRNPGAHDNSSSYHLNVRASWIMETGADQQFIYGERILISPNTYVAANGSVTNRPIPTGAIGIRLWKRLSCSTGAQCTPGDFTFNIEYIGTPPGWTY